MEITHICKTESLFAGAIELEGICAICGQKGILKHGFVGIYCPNCKNDFDFDGGWSRVVRQRREILELSRKEMAKLTGFAQSTIKQYEFGNCSKKYYKLTEELVKKGQ